LSHVKLLLQKRTGYFIKAYGFDENHLIRTFGVREPGEVESHKDLMKLAETKAEKICNGV
jgi:hypothetical protein